MVYSFARMSGKQAMPDVMWMPWLTWYSQMGRVGNVIHDSGS